METLPGEENPKIHYSFFLRPRSQTASAVVNGSQLYLISGYNTLTAHRALPSIQAIGLHGPHEEQTIVIDGNKEESYSSRLAAAVALASGGVLLTGGKGMEQEVFLLSGPDLSIWQRRADMRSPRMGHAAVSLQLDGSEVVMVGGGWDRRGRTLSSVEIFLVSQNVWQEFASMPSPRADFTLQVRHPQIEGIANNQVMNDKVTAIGGYSTNGKFSPPADLTIASSQPVWREWAEGSRRAGFMSTRVSHQWLQDMCRDVYV